MGLSWQQGPLSSGAIGKFLVPQPLPARMLYVEPLRRRMRVRFEKTWIADSEKVLLLFEPTRYPVAYFLESDIVEGVLETSAHVTQHADLGETTWYSVRVGDRVVQRAAWQHTNLPAHAEDLKGRVAFAWRSMDAFFEEDERIVGHAADPYHRIDIRQTSRQLIVKHGETTIAQTSRPQVLYESGFAPRWYVNREDIDLAALKLAENKTFCPYKGVCSYFDIGDARLAAWSYPETYPEVARIADWISFEANKVDVYLDSVQLHLEPGQQVVPHGPDRELTLEELALDNRKL
jgi:uncharacterized protein (DUF427 family)